MSALVHVDMAYLRDVSNDDPREMQKLSQLYVRTMNAQLKKLERAIADHQCKNVEQIAHGAAGSSAVIGMKAVVPSLKEMENLGATGDLRRGADVLSDIRHAFSDICHFLDAHELLKKPSGRLDAIPERE